MIGDWKNSGLCLEDGIKPATATLITFQSIYNYCLEGDTIIDENATFEHFGYRSTELSPQSHKKLVAVCDDCGKVRILPKYNYADLCKPCVGVSPETRRRISENHADLRGRKQSPETIAKRTGKNNPMYGVHICGADHHMFGKERSEEHRRRLSASLQGIPYEEWTGFAPNGAYCEKFDEACRERIRDKYNRECFICGKPEPENITKSGKLKKLSVHHVDMNKNQGCDGHEWVLIPACITHHSPLHTPLWTSRIKYLLANEVA